MISNSISFLPTDKYEILNLINDLDNTASCGHDEIPISVIKSVAPIISEPLSLIINHSIDKAIFPDSLKIAKVIPLHKSGPKNNPSNYRPISLLNTLSKIFEKVIYNRLLNFVNKHNILYNNQFGFRKNHCTEHALIKLVDTITEALDNNKVVCSVFIDLKKAFDTIDNNILIQKLYNYGIRGNCLNLIKSYLTNRYQYVSIANLNSNLASISLGVPQGSILGPILFILYINDIHNASIISNPILFADDTTSTYVANNVAALNTTINEDLEKLYNWLNTNKLSLNITKTNYILFRKSRFKQHDPIFNIQLNQQPIISAKSVCILGVTLDQNLSFKTHLDNIRKKLSSSLYILIKIRDKISKNLALQLYHSLFETHLNYCVSIWGSSCNAYLHPIQILQNKFL